MILDTLIFLDLLMSEHAKALFIIILGVLSYLAIKVVNLLKENGGFNFEEKKIITKKSKSSV